MKKNFTTAAWLLSATLSAALVSAPAAARDDKHLLPIEAALAANDAQNRLGDSVKFYFKGQPTPALLNKIGTDQTSQKTNAFNKTTEQACNWVFLSAMLQLQKHAQQVGANAVINIVSNYNNLEMASATEFECHDGTMMSGVALKGDFVKLADKK